MKKCFMNNMTMHNERRNPMYQTVMIDLALMGALPINVVEALIGAEIPEYITLPKEVVEALDPKKAAAEKAAAENETLGD